MTTRNLLTLLRPFSDTSDHLSRLRGEHLLARWTAAQAFVLVSRGSSPVASTESWRSAIGTRFRRWVRFLDPVVDKIMLLSLFLFLPTCDLSRCGCACSCLARQLNCWWTVLLAVRGQWAAEWLGPISYGKDEGHPPERVHRPCPGDVGTGLAGGARPACRDRAHGASTLGCGLVFCRRFLLVAAHSGFSPGSDRGMPWAEHTPPSFRRS